ncbi:unnamed protein product [Clonostachys rosea f. rosea IK726]|uniref:Uncharacterized protein n=1 Tax=Clonostachys rosea f. rosea IK726 TaxID=1349383 RepID=A0ACA9TUR6_BIOOC|nr:unnamed protein product [Clonostachys rosea f. rosea IK726]
MATKREPARDELNASARDAGQTSHFTRSRGEQPASASHPFSPCVVADGEDINSMSGYPSSGGPLTPPEAPQTSSTIAQASSSNAGPPAPNATPISEDVDMSNDMPAKRGKRSVSTGTVAKRWYRTSKGYTVRIDSIIGKRLARLPAKRNPEHRDRSHKPNLKRRGNVEAMLVQVAGDEAEQACKSCRKGHGPWTRCVVLEGSLCGSCANCWYNACGSRCTFHESKAKYPATSPNIAPLGPYPVSPARSPPTPPPQILYYPPPAPYVPPPAPYFPPPAHYPPQAQFPQAQFPQAPAPSQTTLESFYPPGPAGPPPIDVIQAGGLGVLGPQIMAHFYQAGAAFMAAKEVARASRLKPFERSLARILRASEELGMLMAEHGEQYQNQRWHPIYDPPPPPPRPWFLPWLRIRNSKTRSNNTKRSKLQHRLTSRTLMHTHS